MIEKEKSQRATAVGEEKTGRRETGIRKTKP